MEERTFIRFFLLIPSLIVLYFVFHIFRPFFMPICLAAILATLCYPIYCWIALRLNGRTNWAALLTCLGVTLVILIPFAALVILLAGQASDVYKQFQENVDRGDVDRLLNLRENPYLGPLLAAIEPYVDLDKLNVVGGLAGALQQVSLFFLRHSTEILSGVFRLVTNFFIMVITMFFLFRDGPALVSQLKNRMPLSRRYEEMIVTKFKEVVRATVLGNLLTAIAQGVAGGLVFLLLGIPNVLLWGTMTALFSLVPVVGTAVVWLPWTIYLLAVGSTWKAVILVLLEVLFVGMIDNVLRPILIEGKAKMHTMLVFFSILGGISYFGISGMVIGPVIVALGLTFLKVYGMEYEDELGRTDRS